VSGEDILPMTGSSSSLFVNLDSNCDGENDMEVVLINRSHAREDSGKRKGMRGRRKSYEDDEDEEDQQSEGAERKKGKVETRLETEGGRTEGKGKGAEVSRICDLLGSPKLSRRSSATNKHRTPAGYVGGKMKKDETDSKQRARTPMFLEVACASGFMGCGGEGRNLRKKKRKSYGSRRKGFNTPKGKEGGGKRKEGEEFVVSEFGRSGSTFSSLDVGGRDGETGNGETSCDFGDLDEGVIGRILYGGYLDTVEVCGVVGIVCKGWRRLGGEKCERLDLRGLNLEGRIEGLVGRFGKVKEACFRDCKGLGVGDFKVMGRRWGGTLRVLDLKGTDVGDGVMGEVGAFEKLEVLSVGKTKIEHTRLIGDDGVRSIVEGCRMLKVLDVGFCKVSRMSERAKATGLLRWMELGTENRYTRVPSYKTYLLSNLCYNPNPLIPTLFLHWIPSPIPEPNVVGYRFYRVELPPPLLS